MILVILTALAAVCGAAKLDTSYLPPISARTAGGSPGALLAPLGDSSQGPAGSYTNEVQGVVVDAVNPGTRTSGQEPTGLGGPRTSYGSTNSKVGEAAFTGPISGLESPVPLTRIAPGFGSYVGSAEGDKAGGNSLKFTSDIGLENSYGFETDNGISVGEDGEAAVGVKAQGGFSYKGVDGKTEAAGQVGDGSNDAQKYNAGDYSSNGAGNNKGGSTIGAGDATIGGSYVSQSGQAQRPTSGVLVGTYNTGSVTSQSSSGQSGSQSLGVSGSSSSIGQSGLAGSKGISSQSTDNRFGVQSTKSEGSYAKAQATVGSSPARSPSFGNGALAYSSAVASGSGSASAFASTGTLSSELKNEQIPSFGSAGQRVQGSDSSAGASFPDAATATVLPSSASASASVSGNQPNLEFTQQVPSRFGEGQKTGSSAPSQLASYNTQSSGAGAIDGTYVSSTQKPFIGQEQGSDNSYYYRHPSKPFVTPTAVPSKQYFYNKQPNFPISSVSQQGTGSSGYNGITQAAISPFTTDSSSSFTQTASQSSQFGSKPTTQFGQSSQQTSTQFGSTETLSGSKPIVQSQTQFGQPSNNQNTDSAQSQTQQYQGTIYQYNKPATTLPATNSQTKPGQIDTDSRFGTQQSSSQFGSQSTFQQTQTGSNVQTSQLNQKPVVGSQVSGSSYQFGSIGSQQKPIATQGSVVSSNIQPTQGSSFTYSQSQTQYGQKPVSTIQTGVTSQQNQFVSSGTKFGQNSQSAFGSGSVSTTSKPISSSYQQTQFGSTGTRFGQNSQSTFGSGSVSTTTKPSFGSYQQTQLGSKPQTTQGSSFTYSQTQTQYGQKPVITTQTGITSPQTVLSGSKFGQNSQSTFGSGSVSTTTKPFGSSFQQTQFGSTGSRFGQNSQSTFGSGSVSTTVKPSLGSYQQTQLGSKPQTSQGASFTYSQTQTQYGQKPVTTTQTGVTSQQNQLLSSGSKFGQNSQSTFGSGTVSSTAKPIGSSYQQTQFGSTGSKFGQNSQSTFGTGSISTTPKPFGSSYQQAQFGSTGSRFGQNSQSTFGSGSVSTTVKPSFGSYQPTQLGSKPQTTQGSSFTYSQTQTQYGQKPVTTTQTGVTSPQTVLSGSKFGQNSQSTFGSVSTTAKPIGSSYQQTQFGSTGSKFGQSSQSTFGSGSISTTPKPFGSSFQQTQFGSTGSRFGQNSQSTFGSGTVSTTAKPSFGSYQQTQLGSKPQTTQGSSFTYSQTQTQYGQKPVTTTQTGVTSQQSQLVSSGSKFGQNSQSTFGSVSTTAKPFGSSFQQTQFGSTGSRFGQNSQSTFGSGSVSTTTKPSFGSYQQPQLGSKPQTTQGSSFTYSQTQTQYGQKPVITTQTGVTSPQTVLSGSKFGQNSQSTFGSGSVSTTAKPSFGSYQQTQFGSKPQTTQGSSFTYSQTQTQYGQKPVITTQTGVTSPQTVLSGSKFGQNSQSTFGSGSVSTTTKPFGSSYQQTQFGSTGSRFGQNSQSTFGTGSVSTTAKPSFGSYQQTQLGSKPQTTQGSSFTYSQTQTQYGQKPVTTTQTGVTSQPTQFVSSGTKFGQNAQSAFGSGTVSTTSKPISSSYQQTQFGSTGSRFGQNSQSTFGSGSVSTTAKPSFGSYQQTQLGSKPQTTQGSSFTYSQTQTQYGQKPVSTTQTGVTSQQNQFVSSGSKFDQNSQSTFGSVSTTTKPLGSSLQQTQFGSTGSRFGQNSQTTQGSASSKPIIGIKPVYQQPQFGLSGTQFSQNTQSTQGSVSTVTKPSSGSLTQNKPGTYSQAQAVQTVQYGISSQNTQESTQFGSTPSRFGESSQSVVPITTISQTAQPSPFAEKPVQTQFGSTAAHFGQKPQSQANAFASSSGSNVIPFGSTQTKYQQNSQFGAQNLGVVSTTQKPIASSLLQTNNQQYQYTQSQFGQGLQSNVGNGQITQTTLGAQSQKPFGSQLTQTTYQKNQFTQGQKPFGSSQGSAFQIGQSAVDQPSQSTVQTSSVAGYNYQKPQTVFTTQYVPQDQKVQQTQSNYNAAVSTTQTSINGQTSKPFGISSTQGTFQQSQSTVGSSQFGSQSVKPSTLSGSVIQTSFNQLSGKPVQSASTSTQDSVQSQSSAVSTSQFGIQKPTVLGSKPEYTIQPSQGVVLPSQKPSYISVEPYNPGVSGNNQIQSVPSRIGANEGLIVSTVTAPIIPVPGYEIATSNQGASHEFVGLGEQFGGPRDPPRFDDKTGYHY